MIHPYSSETIFRIKLLCYQTFQASTFKLENLDVHWRLWKFSWNVRLALITTFWTFETITIACPTILENLNLSNTNEQNSKAKNQIQNQIRAGLLQKHSQKQQTIDFQNTTFMLNCIFEFFERSGCLKLKNRLYITTGTPIVAYSQHYWMFQGSKFKFNTRREQKFVALWHFGSVQTFACVNFFGLIIDRRIKFKR